MDYLKLIRLASDVAMLSKDEIRVLAELMVELKDVSPIEQLQFQIGVAFQEKEVVKELA